ncbi:MAG: hypothetical protein ACRCY7_07835 [Cetobacterium sp.]|uniref:hypothetical protein n=1 Tax=Cetobacterium sp. TaxID=2071632 RepID=UPI003F2A36F2
MNGNQPLGFIYETRFQANAIVVPVVCSYIGSSTAVRANDVWDITLDTHSGKLNVTKVINTQISATLYMILIY